VASNAPLCLDCSPMRKMPGSGGAGLLSSALCIVCGRSCALAALCGYPPQREGPEKRCHSHLPFE
jgi:hypothetical protein